MVQKSPGDPLELFQISKEFLAAQQKFLPPAQIYTRLAETMRSIADANASYLQELTRANASFLAAFMERPANGTNEEEDEETPSQAAHHREPAAQ